MSGNSYSVTVLTGTTGSSSISFVPRPSTVADLAGNFATATHAGDEAFDIDKTGGSIALSTPANNSYFTTTQSLVADLTGNTGCSSGGSAVSYYTVNPGGDGVYTWSASYTDSPGNAASLSNGPTFSYTVDHIAPGTLSITVPASTPAYATTFATIDVSTTDATSGVNTVGILVTNSSSQTWSGADWSGTNASWQAASFVSGTTWSYAIPVGITSSNGTYTVIAKSTDMAGNYTITATPNILVVDNVAPGTLSITVPATNPAYAYTFASIDVSTTDATSGVNGVAVLVTNTSSQTWSGTDWSGTNTSWQTASYVSGTTWRYTIPAGITDFNGTYTVIAKSTDRAANYSITGTSNTFIVDKVLPTCTNITRISSNCTNAASVAFHAFMSEAVTGIGTGDFTVTSSNGGSISDLTAMSGNSYSVTVITGSTGSSSISFIPRASTVADLAGNYATATHAGDESFDIDKTGGSIALSTPANNSYFSTTQALVANLTGNTGCSSGGSAVAYYTVNPGGEGIYTWSASYTDAPGNAATLSNGPTFSYTVDNTAPGTLSITVPASNPAYATTFATIDVSTTDATSGINTVGVLITNGSSQTWSGSAWTGDNTSWQPASFVSGTTWSYAIPGGITGTDGTYSVIAKSTDNAGNYSITGTANLFVVDQVAPGTLSITVPASTPAYATTFATIDVSTTDATSGVNGVAVLVTNSSSQTWSGAAWTGDNTSWQTATYVSGSTWRYTIPGGITSSNGTYTVIAKSTDRAGNYTITGTPNILVVDNVAPGTLSITVPATNPAYAYTFASIDVSTTDATSGVNGVAVLVTNTSSQTWSGTDWSGANTSWQTASYVSGTTWRYTIPAGITDFNGTYTVIAKSTDRAANYTITGTSNTIIVDKVLPTCTNITRISSNCTNAASVAFHAFMSEAVTGIGTGDFTVTSSDGGSISDLTAMSGNSYSVTVITGSTGSSSISFIPRASTVADLAGNYATATHAGDESFDIDKTGGSIALSTPANNSYFSTTQALVANLTGNTGCSSGGSAVAFYTVNPGTDGVYTWSASYTDAPGNAATLSNGPTFSYTVDNTAPGTLSITVPASNPAYATTFATVDVSTTDATSGINTVDVLIMNMSSQTWSGTDWSGTNTSWQTASYLSGTTWRYSIPAGITGTDGTYTVVAKSADMVGNYSITGTSNTFVVDHIAPGAISITVPASNPAYATTFASIDVSTTDATSGVNGVAVLVTNNSSQTWSGAAWTGDNTSWQTATYVSGSTWRYTIPGGITGTDGTYTAIAKSTDRAGNYSITAFSNTFIVDNTAPNSVTISSPGINPNYAQSYSTITVTATDGTSGVNAVDIKVQRTSDNQYSDGVGGWGAGVTWISAAYSSGNDWTKNISAITGTDGTYIVTAKATDVALNATTASPSNTFIKDATPPTISALNPADNATGVALGAPLVVVFSEAVNINSSCSNSFMIYKFSDNSTLKNILVTDGSQVSLSSNGKTLTIQPTMELLGGAKMYLTIPNDAVKDLAANYFAGTTSANSWTFTTRPAAYTTLAVGPAATSTTISSLNTTSPLAQYVFSFEVKDDGVNPLADELNTRITTFGIVRGTSDAIGAGNWNSAIAGGYITDGTVTYSTLTLNASDISITGFANSAPGDLGYIADDGSKTFSLYIYLNTNMGSTLKPIVDGKNFQFKVSDVSILTDATKSQIKPSETASSSVSSNTITVVATKLRYLVDAPTWSAASYSVNNHYVVNQNLDALSPGRKVITLEAADANDNRDHDVSGGSNQLWLTAAGGTAFTSPTATTVTLTPNSGTAAFGSAQFGYYTAAGTVTSGNNAGLTNATSGQFVVRAEMPSTQQTIIEYTYSRSSIGLQWSMTGIEGVILIGKSSSGTVANPVTSSYYPPPNLASGVPSNSTTTYSFSSNLSSAATMPGGNGDSKVLYIGTSNRATISGAPLVYNKRCYAFTIYGYNGNYQLSPNYTYPTVNYYNTFAGEPTSTITNAVTAAKSISELADVEVANFKAVLDNEGHVKLSWKTLTEMDNAGFELYRTSKSDQDEYVKIGSFVDREELVGLGLGNTTNGKDYSFKDSPFIQSGEVITYKLVSIAQSDGNSDTQGITEVQTNDDSQLTISEIRPNPVVNNVNFNLTLQTSDNITLDILDMAGATVRTVYNGQSMNNGSHPLSLALNGLASGTYILRVSNGKETILRRFTYMP